jgi:hypothetical protein
MTCAKAVALLATDKRRWQIRSAGTGSKGKDSFGLDQCQARLHTATIRHTVLVMSALAICAIAAARLESRTDTQAPPPNTPDQRPPCEPGTIPYWPGGARHVGDASPVYGFHMERGKAGPDTAGHGGSHRQKIITV